MHMKRIILAVIGAMMATSASAAHLGDVQGAVLVNNQPVYASVDVAQGDRIKVVKGSATLVYSNGAAVPIASGQTLVVLAKAPEPMPANDGGLLPADGHEGEMIIAGTARLGDRDYGCHQTGQPVSGCHCALRLMPAQARQLGVTGKY